MDDTIGIDISKATLDAFRRSTGEHRQFPNDPSGCKALIRWVGTEPLRVVFEPTGPYHRGLELALAKVGLHTIKVNPRSARRFAEVTGVLAKTDRIDARVLAAMGAILDLKGRPAKTEIQYDLKELSVARQALVKDRVAAKNRRHAAVNALLKRQLAARMKQIEGQLAEIDAAIMACVMAAPDLARRFEILCSIPGIGKITAIALLIDMPELGSVDNKQIASLAGLAPMTRQSGGWSGRARIRGGRRQVRNTLYMPAVASLRCNPHLKKTFDTLSNAGKHAKVALTAVMRKLLIFANSLLRDDRKWNEIRA